MDDKQAIDALYRAMYQAMVAKDVSALDSVHADSFVLTHMTGMRQSKREYIAAIADGTLNYYSVVHEAIEVSVRGEHATIVGRSRVAAAVFGGGRHTWRLQLSLQATKHGTRWRFTAARASTY